MNKLQVQMKKAMGSRVQLWLLHLVLMRRVPFNRPHGLRIFKITENGVVLKADLRRNNQNHIGGMHACLLATCCEYASGLMLLRLLDPEKYRIVLKRIQMEYHFQAKRPVFVHFELDWEEVSNSVIQPLREQAAVFREFPVQVYDSEQNHICSGLIYWQIKDWQKVKTK
jgi:acyl-coenzyme A thioesterase PaaI-like protein